MTSQLAFNFEPPAAMNPAKAARAQAAIGRYRSRLSDDDITGRETDIMGLRRRRRIDEPKRRVQVERAARPSVACRLRVSICHGLQSVDS